MQTVLTLPTVMFFCLACMGLLWSDLISMPLAEGVVSNASMKAMMFLASVHMSLESVSSYTRQGAAFNAVGDTHLNRCQRHHIITSQRGM